MTLKEINALKPGDKLRRIIGSSSVDLNYENAKHNMIEGNIYTFKKWYIKGRLIGVIEATSSWDLSKFELVKNKKRSSRFYKGF